MTLTITAFLGNLRGSEILIIALVVLLLFGGRKIPELMRGIGKGVRSFKQGMNDVADEASDASKASKKDSAEGQSEK